MRPRLRLLPKEVLLPKDERTAAMTAAIFLVSLNLLLVGSLAIRRPE
jgi:hypothetical protein